MLKSCVFDKTILFVLVKVVVWKILLDMFCFGEYLQLLNLKFRKCLQLINLWCEKLSAVNW